MKYMGSKNRIAKEILPIILKDRKENQYYVEPFCGGLGTFDKVSGLRIANDKNSDKHVFNHCIKIDQKLSFFSFTDSKINSNNS